MEILQMLHDSEINGCIEWFFDDGWTVWIGDRLNGKKATTTVASALDAEAWLSFKPRKLYPNSVHASATELQ